MPSDEAGRRPDGPWDLPDERRFSTEKRGDGSRLERRPASEARPMTGRLGDRFAAAVDLGEPSRVTTSLDIEDFSRGLLGSDDPLSWLADFVDDVMAREHGLSLGVPAPSSLEVFLMRALRDAGVGERGDKGLDLPDLRVVRPRTSNMFYLRFAQDEVPYSLRVSAYRIEAALNAALLATLYYEDADARPVEALERLRLRTMTSVTAQIPSVDERPSKGAEGWPEGEWHVREGISIALECAQLPYRLQTLFRANVREGRVAMTFDIMPASAMPRHAWVAGAGVVPTTPEMRSRMARDYNLRVGLLVAACAFRSSEKVREVWVAGCVDTERRHSCLVSARFDRERFSEIDLSGPLDLVATYRRFSTDPDFSGISLSPITQGFSLEDERFCPPRRYDSVELSARPLEEPYATALGARRVCDLAIDEGALRREVAAQLARDFGTSCERDVSAILALTQDSADRSVREAGMRCVEGLVSGRLDDGDPLAFEEDFVSGDALSRALREAGDLLMSGDDEGALRALEGALSRTGVMASLVDDEWVQWRAFEGYSDRALYNRLVWDRRHETRLVPAGYLDVVALSSTIALARGDADLAIARAREAVRVAPMSANAHFQLAKCLLVQDRGDEARAELNDLLSVAHDARSISYGYYGMALLLWDEGEVLPARACYQIASSLVPISVITPFGSISQLALSGKGRLSPEQVADALESAGVVQAPTQEVTEAFDQCARAAMDAEVFPVARELMRKLDGVMRDDVCLSILRSLEGEPDR